MDANLSTVYFVRIEVDQDIDQDKTLFYNENEVFLSFFSMEKSC